MSKTSENILQKDDIAETMMMYAGIGLYSVFKVVVGTLKCVLSFFIGLFGLYVYLGLIGVVLVWVLDAVLHGIAGK